MKLQEKQKIWNHFINEFRLPFLMHFQANEATLLENLTLIDSKTFRENNFLFYDLEFTKNNQKFLVRYSTGELKTCITIQVDGVYKFSTAGRFIYRNNEFNHLDDIHIELLDSLIATIVDIVKR
jgi:hypothetical protein